ncbi:MAG: photosystem II stability/assembly factor-like uncharacterized protein [Planctomycetota bacterium]
MSERQSWKFRLKYSRTSRFDPGATLIRCVATKASGDPTAGLCSLLLVWRPPANPKRAISVNTLCALLFGLLLSDETESKRPVPPVAEDPPLLAEALLEDLTWRNIGPANMGGRVVDLAVHPGRARIYYVATATGGLWKTTNGGTNFKPVFQFEGSGSVGAVAIAPSVPETVWVGTGESNPRNSVSWGKGVWRSVDGGENWERRGLEKTLHIAQVEVHPTDPALVFVAAMGSTWGPGPDRGLYRTKDGGASWEKVLFVDEQTGCIDVRIDPEDPSVVYAATYERMRDEFDSNDPAQQTGPGSGLWRSLDGGTTWERLQNGLPTVAMGRIGIDLFQADSRTLFAIIETERTGERGAPPRAEDRVSLGIRGVDAEEGGFLVERITAGESGAQAGLEVGDVILQLGSTLIPDRATLVEAMRDYAPGDEAELVYLRGDAEEAGSIRFLGRLLRTQARSYAGSQGGQVANAQGQQGAEGLESGGVFRSDDRGTTWRRINSLNPRPFYYSQVRVDPEDDQRVYVLGISIHASTDGGERFRVIGAQVHADHHALWVDPGDFEHLVLGCDGGVYTSVDGGASWEHQDNLSAGQFYNIAVDDRTPYNVFGGLQDNGTWGGPSATRQGGIATHEWIKVGGGDGFGVAVDPTDQDVLYTESQNGAISRQNLRTGEQERIARPQGRRNMRFAWNTPFLLSAHNSDMFFYAGEVVVRSINRGRTAETISPEITRTERGHATALAQSPLDADTLYVGSDDGALWRTLNGGTEWVDVTEGLIGLDGPRYVADIEPSPHDAATVFVVFDGHRSNDFTPHILVSDDDGKTWERIVSGIPAGDVVRSLVVDRVNRNLLFAGTEFGVYVSIDRGASWTPFRGGLPTVPVYDLVIQQREQDLVAGTHGRGIWIADIAPLQALDAEVLSAGPALLPVQPARTWGRRPGPETSGDRGWSGTNPAAGAALYYYLPEDREDDVSLVVRDAGGNRLRSLEGSGKAGLHLVRWDLRVQRNRGQGGRGQAARRQSGGGFGGGAVDVGDYSVTLELGGTTDPVERLRVLPDPMTSDPALWPGR